MKNKTLAFVLAGALCASCAGETVVESYDVIPAPAKIEMEGDGGYFTVSKGTKIAVRECGDEALQADMMRNAEFLRDWIGEAAGLRLEIVTAGADEDLRGAVVLEADAELPKEGYRLEVEPDGIEIEGSAGAGMFYGAQTLRKIISVPQGRTVKIACGKIEDGPRFGYRGVHLDVSRHMFPVEFIKRYIDILALHNVNVFHWHLTDDQGWRIEIKSRPELIEKGSMRSGTVIRQEWGTSDGVPYGGYYTQEEAREIVEYAAQRYITVIPEIDMPGHMLAALTAYPELGCTGGPYEVWTRWGVSEDVLCVGKEETFKFLEDVFSEIIDIFPSEYIHVGGDECPKVRWESCPACQARIRQLGIRADKEHTAEQKLQSYAIERMEKFINSKGRKVIGWDEILEGGLAPNAAVMSWTGIAGGVKAAQMGHYVVMSPNANLYFDHYQSTEREKEPFGIGGYLTVERVYGFEPVPAQIRGTEAEHYIMGAQANLWTEYIKTGEHAEYMLLPRLAALSEVQWSSPERKDWNDFLRRMRSMVKIYDLYGYNYARHIFDVEGTFVADEATRTIQAVLTTGMGGDIWWTADGTPAADSLGRLSSGARKYEGPVTIDRDMKFSAVAVYDGKAGRVLEREFAFNKATAHPVESLSPMRPDFGGGRADVLVDGIKGDDAYRSGRWVAWYDVDMDVVIDMADAQGQVPEYSEVSFDVFVLKGDWIFGARRAEVLVSQDGREYRSVGVQEYPAMTRDDEDGIRTLTFTLEPQTARFLRIKASPEFSIPQWHGGKGNPSFLIVDEIAVK